MIRSFAVAGVAGFLMLAWPAPGVRGQDVGQPEEVRLVRLGVNVVPLRTGLGVHSFWNRHGLAARMRIPERSILLAITGTYRKPDGGQGTVTRPTQNMSRLTRQGLRTVLDRDGLNRIEITWQKGGRRYRNWARLPRGGQYGGPMDNWDVGEPAEVQD